MELSRQGDGAVLSLSGVLSLHTTAPLFRQVMELSKKPARGTLEVDLTAVEECDTAGAALIACAGHRLAGTPDKFTVVGANAQVASMLAIVENSTPAADVVATRHHSRGILLEVGGFALRVLHNARETIEYVGSLAHASFRVVCNPRGLRWQDTLRYMASTGADALGIVALVNLLVGVIVAFQSLEQLVNYGLDVYVVEAVGISITRELGPLMTAIIVAGRSGSGFAAEIGTMTVNEEVAALDTMGLDRTQFLVMPKLIALMVMMPLLVIFADAVGCAGGMLVAATSIDLPMGTYLARMGTSLDLWDVFQGLIKAQVYAAIVAAVGCLRGLQTRRGAQGVGLSTTSAVVTSLFLIIVADAILTVIYAQFG